jgi:uncharacterized protein YndB with AHSA1/START domain
MAASMGPISLDIAVDAPREEVFDLLCDLAKRPAWTDHFQSDFRLERVEPSGQGAAAHFRVGAPGVRYMDTTIVEAERPHIIVERGHGGRSNRLEIKTVWELTEGPGAVTTVGLTFWIEPKRHRGARWWRRRWKRALRRLDAAVRAGVSPGGEAKVAGGNRRLTGIA